MKNRLQIRLRGPNFRRSLADGTTSGRRIGENLSSRSRIFAFDSTSPTGLLGHVHATVDMQGFTSDIGGRR
jgi:hypothetical protein